MSDTAVRGRSLLARWPLVVPVVAFVVLAVAWVRPEQELLLVLVAVALVGSIVAAVHHAEVVSLKGDSYRLKDRDLGRVPAASKTGDQLDQQPARGVHFRPSPGGPGSTAVDNARP